MSGKHISENIEAAVEKIINRFEFNKSKCSSVIADKGSSILRLFKQIQPQLEEEIKDLENMIIQTNSNSEDLENEQQEEKNQEQDEIREEKEDESEKS